MTTHIVFAIASGLATFISVFLKIVMKDGNL